MKRRRRVGLVLAALAAVLACRPPEPPELPRPRPPLPPAGEPVEVVEPAPPAPPVEVPAPVPVGPLELRVGLATDLEELTFLCCQQEITVSAGGASWATDQSLTIRPAGTIAERAIYRLQVAALKDEHQAQGIADYLTEATSEPADSVFDADTDLYRVRFGRFASRDEAEAGRGQLETLGIIQSWVASEGGAIQDPAFQLEGRAPNGEQGIRLVPGRWLEVRRPGDEGLRVLDRKFRGKILIYLNDRGLLNVINEVELEEYLRGVVPKEMGPELYNQLEALKAQAVAARTYAVRQIDAFADEGYDICSTPRCQVYGGMGNEHPVSDRAIRETRGQIVLAYGEPAETFYGATCGGHTENVEVVFPLKTGAYLRGVPCIEAGVGTIRGARVEGASLPEVLARRLLPVDAAADLDRAARLSARFERLAALAGLPVPADHLRSVSRKEVRRFVASVFDLVLDYRLLGSSEELRVLLAASPPEWSGRELRLARYFADAGLSEKPRQQALSESETQQLLFELALYLGVLRRESTRYLEVEDGRLTVRVGAESRVHVLPEDLATFLRRGQALASGPLELMAGDRLDFYWQGERLLALAQPDEARPVSLDRRRAPRQSWRHFRTRRQVAAAVQARYPGFPFEDFEVLSRGVSGRVGKLELQGTGGRTLRVEGLAVRWTLDVYDTNFEAQEVVTEDRGEGWVFRGRGWGHGVGMCQAGAYAMAVRGSDYRSILEHYYTGIELGRLKPVPLRPRLASVWTPSEKREVARWEGNERVD